MSAPPKETTAPKPRVIKLSKYSLEQISLGKTTKAQAELVERGLLGILASNGIHVESVDDLGRNYGKPISCKTCRNTFDPIMDKWSEEDWNICRACGYARSKKAFGTPALYKDCELLNEDFAKYTDDQREMLLSNSLYIFGPAGTGKTYLGFAICHTLLKSHSIRSGRFVEFHDLTKYFRAAYRPPRYLTEEQLLRDFTSAPLIFLDDVFGSREGDKPSEQENHVFYEVIRERNHKKLRTIITSNFNFEQLEKKGFNVRTTSRMAELCQEVALDGLDRRIEMKPAPPTVGK